MNEEAKKNYIQRGGNSCFHCGSENIEGGSFSTDSGVAQQAVWCNGCEHEWVDGYTLTSVRDNQA